jgi:hypothetical protein
MLEVLTDWVEKGLPPSDLVQVHQETEPPFIAISARPMCRYSAYHIFGAASQPRQKVSRVWHRKAPDKAADWVGGAAA